MMNVEEISLLDSKASAINTNALIHSTWLIQDPGRNQIISSAASQGVVSGEFATGNGLASSTAPMILTLHQAGATLTSTREAIFGAA
jgi:hypothetical protein